MNLLESRWVPAASLRAPRARHGFLRPTPRANGSTFAGRTRGKSYRAFPGNRAVRSLATGRSTGKTTRFRKRNRDTALSAFAANGLFFPFLAPDTFNREDLRTLRPRQTASRHYTRRRALWSIQNCAEGEKGRGGRSSDTRANYPYVECDKSWLRFALYYLQHCFLRNPFPSLSLSLSPSFSFSPLFLSLAYPRLHPNYSAPPGQPISTIIG